MHVVVVEDATGKQAPGSVIEGTGKALAASNNGQLAVLPYDAELPQLANMVYAQSFFGDGWLFSRNAGERGCPIILQSNKRCRYIYWAARVEPVSATNPMQGSIRLVHSSDHSRSVGYGMRQLQFVASLPPPDARGGATVYGKGEFAAGMEGLLFLELYVVGRLRVRWLAVTQHQVSREVG